MLHVYYSDHVAMPLPDGHPFPRDKYRLARERVEATADELAVALRPAPAVTDVELTRVHTADYVRRVRAGELTAHEQRAIGFPWSPGFVERQLHSTGATLAAARDVALGWRDGEYAWGAHLAGGTHHAFAARGQGFCVFNDVAVAARALQAERLARRVLVFDADVHQGNGTAALFADDASVFTVSLHGAKNFPRVKEPSDLDYPLPDGCRDDEYLATLDRALDETFQRFDPEFVFYVAGADPHERDRYGRMSLTTEGLRERDRRIARVFAERRLPLVGVMGGGYARDVDLVASIYAGTVEELARGALALQQSAEEQKLTGR